MCARAAVDIPTLQVNETFVSIQGEGRLIGLPSFFIRLDGCPLRCTWCDTPYALAGDAGHAALVEQLVRDAAPYHHIVITGGEPLAQDIAPLTRRLAGHHITVESSATIFADLPEVALFSLSPKVGTSGYVPKPIILRKYFASAAGRLQLKFVIGGERDLDDAGACLATLADGLPPGTPIIFQPESGRAGRGESYHRFLTWLTEAVLARAGLRALDVAVLPQLHYLLWQGEAGR
jgi:7-carboxy-7-deazaguanine synthase